MCHGNEEWCKIWRGIDLSFQNWHGEFDEFWPEHLKISKIFPFMGSFWAEYILSELKNTEELSFMILKSDTKLGEEPTCRLKIDMRNLTNFDLSTWKFQKNFPLIGSFSAKYILFELKKYRGVISHDTEEWYKIWRQIGLLF